MSVQVPGFPHLRYVGQAAAKPAEQRDQPFFLRALDSVGAALGRTVDIFSGSGGPDVRGAGFRGDPHDRAIAADATVGGVPIGDYPGGVEAIHAAGLRSGATDFTYQGKPDPAHVDAVGIPGNATPPATSGMISVTTAVVRIVKGSLARALDPFAVVAVSQTEGLSGRIGDNGHAFGPFQLNDAGGQFPGQIANRSTAGWSPSQKNAWAWSSQGIDYALDRIKPVAAGQKGQRAVHSIVYGFEQPNDKAGETAKANANYTKLLGQTGGDPGSIAGKVVGTNVDIGGAVGGAIGAIPGVGTVEAAGTLLSRLTDPGYLLRGLQIVAGAVLVLAGLLLLTRQVALAADLPDPVGVAAAAAKIPA